MKYIIEVNNDKQVVSSKYPILYLSDDGGTVYVKQPLSQYIINLSANEEGVLYVNLGYINANGFIVYGDDGTTNKFAYNSAKNKVVDGIVYYEYESSALGEFYLTQDLEKKSKGEVVNINVYVYDEETKSMTDGGNVDVTVMKYDPSYEGPIEEIITYSSGDCQTIGISSEIVTVQTNTDREGVKPDNYSLTSIIIPDTVTNLVKQSFTLCHELLSVELPDTITVIPQDTFRSCSKLSAITANQITEIGNDAFENTGFVNLDFLPNTLKTIKEYGFATCTSLTAITLPNSVEKIGNACFLRCSNVETIVLPNNLTTISNSLLNGCSSLTSVTIPDSVTSIGNSAFYNCSGLTSVTIPNSVTSIGQYAFQSCISLTSVTIPNSVTTIGSYTFNGCTSLALVTIPNSVTSIDWWAFNECTSLTSITIPNSITSIGNNAFRNCQNLETVTYKGVDYKSKSSITTALSDNGVSVGTSVFEDTKLED